MHPALEIHEILLKIFPDCYDPSESTQTSDRARALLARTCRAFREPALDLLWDTLPGLSPLVQCLPEASHKLSTGEFSFRRPLTDTEWDVLQSYARRVRTIRSLDHGLDEESLRMLADAPANEPLFPNLRCLHSEYDSQTRHLLRISFPSLMSLHVHFWKPNGFGDALESFATFSPNVKRLAIEVNWSDVTTFTKTASYCICQWQNMQSVICPQIGLDIDALIHLSRMPVLSSLAFALDSAFPVLDSPLLFPNLRNLTLHSQGFHPVSHLLSHSQLPVIAFFTVSIDDYPSQKELSSLLSHILTSGAGQTIKSLSLERRDGSRSSEALILDMEDLQPCLAFSNLDDFQLEIRSPVDLKGNGLLALKGPCPVGYLDADACLHLCRMPALSRLGFARNATFPLNSSLLFSNLFHLTLCSQGLHRISQFLSHSRLPVTRSFSVSTGNCPSRQELSSFLSSVLMSGASQTIELLALEGDLADYSEYQDSEESSSEGGSEDLDSEQSSSGDDSLRSEALILDLEDLQPCLTLSNLSVLRLDIKWHVNLEDGGILALASSWPRLEVFCINMHYGWNTQGGITPNGLLQLFQICPSLCSINVAVDTRGYTELPSSGLLANQTLSRIFIDIIDSKIEAESVPAIAAFFAPTPNSTIELEYCTWWDDIPGGGVYCDRWDDVRGLMGLPKLYYV